MDNILKIREVSTIYDISARTLRYYEDMGLLNSIRSDDYAYRMYDNAAIKRLEQILILRKLNISIKDIKRIFSTSGSEVVLEILNKKVDDIDDEVALLHELREVVLEFIIQIQNADFGKESDISLLYEKAKEIEQQLVNVDYNGNASNVNRLLEITEKLDKKPDVRIVEFPKCRMLSSGISTEPDLFAPNGLLMHFNEVWMKISSLRKDRFFARDFMWYDAETGGTAWWYALEDWMTDIDTEGFEIVNFEGGLYAAAISKDSDNADGSRVMNGIYDWIINSDNFEPDDRPGHYPMYHIAGSPLSDKALGYGQLEIFRPIRIKS